MNNADTLCVTDSTFVDSHSADCAGGAINNSNRTLHVTNSTFYSNTSSYGAAIAQNGGGATVTNSTFSGNRVAFGGIIDSSYGELTLRNSTVANSSGANCCGATIPTPPATRWAATRLPITAVQRKP